MRRKVLEAKLCYQNRRSSQHCASGDLRLDRIIALINPENKLPAHVALKLGFVLERSVRRDDGYVKNLYCRISAKSETAA